jgi:hypothetical protein
MPGVLTRQPVSGIRNVYCRPPTCYCLAHQQPGVHEGDAALTPTNTSETEIAPGVLQPGRVWDWITPRMTPSTVPLQPGLDEVAAISTTLIADAPYLASTTSLDHIANRSGQKFKDNVQ